MSTARRAIGRPAGVREAGSTAATSPHDAGLAPPARFAARHPYRFAALLVAALVVAYRAAGTVAALLHLPSTNTAPAFFVADLVLAGLGAALLTGLGWWRHVGFRSPAAWRDLRRYWLPAALILVNAAFIRGGGASGGPPTSPPWPG